MFLLLFVLFVVSLLMALPLGFAFVAAAAALRLLPLPLFLHFLLLEETHKTTFVLCGSKK